MPGDRSYGVVVVGGGIAGAALATALARAGLEPLLLERDIACRDKVRGEYMAPWGVAEMLRLGLEKDLLAAGGGYVTSAAGYDEVLEPAEALARAAALDQFLPGVPGGLTVGHPQASAALLQSAADAGAVVLRGVGGIDVGDRRIRYRHDGRTSESRCGLVVGADGRHSAVRRQRGIGLHQTAPATGITGMLVEGLDGWPAHQIWVGTEGRLRYFVMPRFGGTARLYLAYRAGDPPLSGGSHRTAQFLAAYAPRCVPDAADVFAATTPAGPCVSYKNNDGWTDSPVAPGAVLIGDAAGWSDPIIGQGLSVAMRDARTVAEVLCAGRGWSPAAFGGYTEERAERMRRLRITAAVETEMHSTFTAEGAVRRRAWIERAPADPLLSRVELAEALGPENVAAECFGRENLARIRAFAA